MCFQKIKPNSTICVFKKLSRVSNCFFARRQQEEGRQERGARWPGAGASSSSMQILLQGFLQKVLEDLLEQKNHVICKHHEKYLYHSILYIIRCLRNL